MPAKNGRNISLTDEQQSMIDGLVQSGRYGTASEVVREGLRLLEREEEARLIDKWLLEGLTAKEEASVSAGLLEQARLALRAKVREGLEQARKGQFVDGDEFFARWKQRIQAAATCQAQKPRVRRRP